MVLELGLRLRLVLSLRLWLAFTVKGGVGFGVLQHSDRTLNEEPMEAGWKVTGRNFGVVIVGFALPYPTHLFVCGMLVK